MITRRCHYEVEVAIDLLAIALGDYGLKGGGGLLKGSARLCRRHRRVHGGEGRAREGRSRRNAGRG